MYLTSAEWDLYRLDNEWLVKRFQEIAPKKLLGLYIEPGMNHGEIPHDEISRIFEHYLGTERKVTDTDEKYVAAKKKLEEEMAAMI